MKKLVSVLFLISCGASVDTKGMGDDTNPGDPTGDAGTDDPPIESATVKFAQTFVHDERGDAIDFSSGEPVHAHGGPLATLGTANCTEVYKYGYLMNGPKFGKETAPNDVSWKIELQNVAALDLAQTSFRIYGDDPAFIADWATLPYAGNSTIVAKAHGTPTGGKMFVDVRTVSKHGEETITSACWYLHVLSAPIEVQPARTESNGLMAMSMQTDAQLVSLLNGALVPVYSQRYVHYTQEPIALEIDVAQPTATFAKRIVDDYALTRTGASGVQCVDYMGFDTGEPICTATVPTDPPDASATGSLADLVWTLTVIDETTGTDANCTVSGLHATCQLPARAITEGARPLRAVLSFARPSELAPYSPGPYVTRSLLGLTFVGRTLDTTQTCLEMQAVTHFGNTIVVCKTFAEYTHFQALDHAQLSFSAVPFSVKTNGVTPYHVSGAAMTIGASTWDAGDDDLPGPQ